MNLQKLLKQAQEMQNKLTEAQSKMAEAEFEGKSGGGMVVITINGKGEMKKINISPEIIKAEEKEVLEDLIIAAFADAKTKADSQFSDSMNSVTSDFQMPPGFKLPI